MLLVIPVQSFVSSFVKSDNATSARGWPTAFVITTMGVYSDHCDADGTDLEAYTPGSIHRGSQRNLNHKPLQQTAKVIYHMATSPTDHTITRPNHHSSTPPFGHATTIHTTTWPHHHPAMPLPLLVAAFRAAWLTCIPFVVTMFPWRPPGERWLGLLKTENKRDVQQPPPSTRRQVSPHVDVEAHL